MDQLNDLIKMLCPNGVKKVPLGSLMKRVREKGKSDSKVSQVYVVSNTQGIVRAEDFRENTIHSSNTSNYTIIREGMFAYNPSRLNIGSIGMLNYSEPGLVSPMYVVFEINQSIVRKEYFEYLIQSSFVNKMINSFKEEGARFRFDYARWDWIEVQIPPLEVQDSIIYQLNKFVSLINGLNEELSLRYKQYDYYEKKILSDNNYPKKRLGDTCKMKSGKAIKSSMLSTDVNSSHQYPCFGGNGIRGYIGRASHHGSYPIIGRQGALCGNVNYAEGDFYATEHAVVVESLGEYDQRYLFYLLTAMNLNQYKSQGAQPGLAVGNIENLIAPVPPLEQQKLIVSSLDYFEELCNSSESGLQAEISLRQKQYEYYRDKLLTFKEAV